MLYLWHAHASAGCGGARHDLPQDDAQAVNITLRQGVQDVATPENTET